MNKYSRSISSVYQFFRSLNTNKKFDEDSLKDLLKSKPNLVAKIIEKINEISLIQQKKLIFNENSERSMSLQSKTKHFMQFCTDNIHKIKNFEWKINITISNNNQLRVIVYSINFIQVLNPEIILILSLNNGEVIYLNVDVKIFQELRKSIAYSIKKIIDNESVLLLK